jgi:predicted dehydrogenase
MGAVSFEHGHQFGYLRAMLRLPQIELVALSEPDDELRARAEAELRANRPDTPEADLAPTTVRVLRDHHELLDAPDIDAVCIASANVSHHALTLRAAAAGKHVLCEKPLAIGLDEATEMVRACRDRGVILGTAYPVRHAPSVWEAKQRLAAGELGPIRAMSVTNVLRDTASGWFIDPARSGGGAIRDHIVHGTDLMRWLGGSEVRELYCEAATRMRDIPVEDTGMLIEVFDDGVVASCDPSWNRPRTWPKWGDVTGRIECARGLVEFDVTGDFVVRTDAQAVPNTQHISYGPDMNEHLIADFADAILEGREPCAGGRDGWAGVACIEAAYESARSHQFVTVARFEDHVAPGP